MIYFIDLDGTLINSKQRHCILMKKILKKEKLDHNFNEKSYFQKKEDGMNNYNYLIKELKINKSQAKKICKKWVRHIEDIKYIKSDKLYHDTTDFLENIRKKNKNKIVFLTSRKKYINLILELKKLNIIKYADKIIKVSTKNAGKEKEKYINKFIKKNQHNSYVLIGDSEAEIYAARKSNISYFILNRGFRSEKFLENYNIKTYKNLETIYERIVTNEKL